MTTPTDADEFTELVDFVPSRVDLVNKGANGIHSFVIAKADASAGADLLDPEFVRGLISKQAPGTGSEEGVVTITGKPEDVAKMIHEAAQRGREHAEQVAKGMADYPDDPIEVAKAKAEYDLVCKAKYSAQDKRDMAKSGEAMEDGSYPVKDEDDLGNAVRAVGRGGADHDAIRRHVIKRAKAMGKSSAIPDNWGSDGSLKDSVSKADGDDDSDTNAGPDLDPTVALADPDIDAPGDPMEPGSPAWEAIDAATACKWTSILARAKVAIDLMAEREMLEAVSADPDDAQNAFDLQDACCAIDYAIGVLAPFAVGEASEAEQGALAMVGKAMAGMETVPLDRVEALAAVAKAGRVLSAASMTEIQDAAGALHKALAVIPAEVAKGKEPAVADETETPAPEQDGGSSEDVAKAGHGPDDGQSSSGEGAPDAQAASSGATDQGGADSIGSTEAPAETPPGRQVAKAGGPMMVVYGADGKIAGIVDPGDLLPAVVAGECEDALDGDGDGDADDLDGEVPADGPAAAAAVDLAPVPAGDAGLHADEVGKAADGETGDQAADQVAKQAVEDGETITVTKAELTSLVASEVQTALDGRSTELNAAIAKAAQLEDEVTALKGQVAHLEEQPATPKVFTNGQLPPEHMMRGQDRSPQGGPRVDVAKAAEMKQTLYRGTAPEQNQAAIDLQTLAIAQLREIHAGNSR